MGGALADEVVGLVQGLLLEVAGAVGVLGYHQHVLLGHQGLVTSRGPSRGPGQGGVPAHPLELHSSGLSTGRGLARQLRQWGHHTPALGPHLDCAEGGQPLWPDGSSGSLEAAPLKSTRPPGAPPSFSAGHPSSPPRPHLLQGDHSNQQDPGHHLSSQAPSGVLWGDLEVPRGCWPLTPGTRGHILAE